MTDFRVVPAALKLDADRVRVASDYWATAHLAILNGLPMNEIALGKESSALKIVQTFNECAEKLCVKLVDGANAIDGAADKLTAVAQHFENVDAEYYRQFGYIDEGLGY